jgi:hypothetical protein
MMASVFTLFVNCVNIHVIVSNAFSVPDIAADNESGFLDNRKVIIANGSSASVKVQLGKESFLFNHELIIP